MSVRTRRIADLTIAILLVLAFVMPPVGLIASVVLTASAVRNHEKVISRRYGGMLLLSAITTAALIAGWSHDLNLMFFLMGLAFAVVVGLGLHAAVSLVAGAVRNRRGSVA